ncbi:hypothetical protein SCALIN_C03_0023 [Candidatus Scalindua japonica]|uniref:PEP-CTERM protein-sorting domain-containing protein n=1 Tax=Candidatus Scalindua japonica TaxID=1284222 RepID=A0A286TU09_9BACT|nr:hypothetical protein [Candidatus Scalindua japonica]GAX59366.1 hypothetical protein SCALIN_C03_0023 [Candidatus Scalindua japonica]
MSRKILSITKPETILFVHKVVFICLVLAISMVLATQAQGDLIITPGDEVTSGNQTSNRAIIDKLITDGYISSAADSVYKQDVGGSESGVAAGSYETTFSNTSGDPEDALIEYVGTGAFISDAFALVKDGNHTPAWYGFDLSSSGLNWNGTESLSFEDFWPAGGAISHVEIFGSVSVPEPSLELLLGLSLIGLVGVGAVRKIKQKKVASC